MAISLENCCSTPGWAKNASARKVFPCAFVLFPIAYTGYWKNGRAPFSQEQNNKPAFLGLAK